MDGMTDEDLTLAAIAETRGNEVDGMRDHAWLSYQSNVRKVDGMSLCMAHTPTLRAPLSGTLLLTLPDLVTPLKGHSLSPRSCPATRLAPSEKVRVPIRL